MSEITTNTGLEDTDEGRVGKAKAALGQAGQSIRNEAQTFADAAGARVRSEAQKQQDTATKTLGDFANAIRRAGDELSQADQSPAAKLVRQAADGLEGVSRNLAVKRPEDLLNDVRNFGRSHPAAFIGGAVLVGVALGRFLRASETAAPGPDEAIGAESLADEALALAEEDGFDGPAEAGGGVEAPIRDDLGDLKPSDVER